VCGNILLGYSEPADSGALFQGDEMTLAMASQIVAEMVPEALSAEGPAISVRERRFVVPATWRITVDIDRTFELLDVPGYLGGFPDCMPATRADLWGLHRNAVGTEVFSPWAPFSLQQLLGFCRKHRRTLKQFLTLFPYAYLGNRYLVLVRARPGTWKLTATHEEFPLRAALRAHGTTRLALLR